MNPREYWGLSEAYAKVYSPEQNNEVDTLESEDYITEMGQVRTTGQTSSVFRPTPGAGSAGGVGTRSRSSGSSPGALRPSATAPKPAAAPKPASTAPRPAPRPAATAPRPTATAPRPAAPPASKPTPTTTSKPPVGSGYKKDTSITDMIGRSQIRQGAPINTGSSSSDVRSMAARGTAVGGSTPSPTSKSAPSRPMGSRKPGSIVSGLDMFDLVKGYLLDEGYADTEEAAIKIMANMSEEWRESILESGYFPTPESRRADEAKYGLRGQTVKPRTVQTQAASKMKPTLTK